MPRRRTSRQRTTSPITALINARSRFRAGILAKTGKYDEYNDIGQSQLYVSVDKSHYPGENKGDVLV